MSQRSPVARAPPTAIAYNVGPTRTTAPTSMDEVFGRSRVAGRPVLPRLDLAAQRRRAMSRCQRKMVSGVTSSRSPWRRAFGITASSDAIRARSAQSSLGRRGCRRCRTASWWRRIKISAVFHVSSCRASRSHAASRVVRRNMNRRHRTGDHHGGTAGRATLLARAMDEILGTHNTSRPASSGLRGRADRVDIAKRRPALIADSQIRAACTVAALLLLYRTGPG